MPLIMQKRASGQIQVMASGSVSQHNVVGKVGKKQTNLVTFRIAYDYVISERSGNRLKQFITCNCYARTATYAQHLVNGDVVFITGWLRENDYNAVKHPEDKYYIMVTTIFIQPKVFEQTEKYRRRVTARRQGYVVEDDAEGEDYLSRQNIKDDMATPNIQDEDLPF